MFALQAKIFELLKCGKDDAAIKVLYKVVFPKVRNYIKKNGGSFEDAQDAFQDGIAIFYKQWHLGKIDLDKDIESYIFVISRNVWLNMLTKNKRVSNNIDILEEQQLKSDIDILNFMVTEERNQYIQKLLDAIGSKCKEMLINSVFYKKSMQEIMLEMGYANENAAKSTNYRCKQRLIELLQGKNEIRDLMQNE